MTAFDKWWTEMVQRRPQLLNEDIKITMTVAQLKANLNRAYDAGWAKAGMEQNAIDPFPFPFNR